MAFSAIVNGLTVSILWRWFIVSKFDLPALTIPQAMGFSLVVSYLTVVLKKDESNQPYWKTLLEGFLTSVIKATFALIIGLCINIFN